jgi:hypothetical protein
MGWFSKTIPERKWTGVSVTLAQKLQSIASSWYVTFRRGAAEHHVSVKPDEIGDVAKRYISMLQLSAVAATLQESAYVTDAVFFLELVYIILTQNPPAALHRDIESLPFALAGDARESLMLWAHCMAREVSTSADNPKLLEELNRYGALLVIQAKIATCEACDDFKGAEKVRKVFAS